MHHIPSHPNLLPMALACLGLVVAPSSEALTQVSINPETKEHAITEMAIGTNLVYAWHADNFFAEGEVAHIVRDIGLGSLRWPGGTVTTYYHWDALIGHGWNDSWNPDWDPSANLAPEEFMDLEEYLALVDETGVAIMLGVNMSSGREWNRETEGVEEAVRLMEYCHNRGYDVQYVYFDNENYHDGNNFNRDVDGDGEAWTATSYGESFAVYAAAVKTVYPEAKLIANWRANPGSSGFESDMRAMLEQAGNVIDFVDLHYYWQWNTASWDLWKSQKPMVRTGTSKTYGEDVAQANAIFAQMGYPHIRTAVLEWNIGPGPWQTDPSHTLYKTALMQSEMQMQMLQGGLDIGMLYTLESPLTDMATTKHIIHNGKATASALWIWLFSKAAGKVVVQSSTNKAGIYVVALEGPSGEILVYLLNKTNTEETVDLGLQGFGLADVSEAWRFHDGGSGRGALQPIGLWEAGSSLRTTLKADSLNMIGLAYPSLDQPAVPVLQYRMARAIPTGIIAAWDHGPGEPDILVNGVEAVLSGSFYETDPTAGSTDGSFGGELEGARSDLTAITVRMENGKNALSLQVVNRTGLPLQLNTVHFDYAPWWLKSPRDVALVYMGGDLDGVAPGTVLQGASDLINLGSKKGDYPDFDWSLAGLPDRILGHNEMAVFNLEVSNAAPDGTWANGAFDNIALTGESAVAGPLAMVLDWRAETGHRYVLQKSSTLQPEDWQPASGTLIGYPGDMSATIEMESNPEFLRLDVDP